MADKKLVSIINDARATTENAPVVILDMLSNILSKYEEEDLVVTPWTRCEIIVKGLDSVSNLNLSQDDIDYITQSILYHKGLWRSVEKYSEFSGTEITSKKNPDGSIVITFKTIRVKGEYLKDIKDLMVTLIKELIFHSSPTDSNEYIQFETIITDLEVHTKVTDLVLHNLETLVFEFDVIE